MQYFLSKIHFSNKLVLYSDHSFLSFIHCILRLLGFSALLLSCRDSQTPGPMWEHRRLWSRPKRSRFPPLNYASAQTWRATINQMWNTLWLAVEMKRRRRKKDKSAGWWCEKRESLRISVSLSMVLSNHNLNGRMLPRNNSLSVFNCCFALWSKQTETELNVSLVLNLYFN